MFPLVCWNLGLIEVFFFHLDSVCWLCLGILFIVSSFWTGFPGTPFVFWVNFNKKKLSFEVTFGFLGSLSLKILLGQRYDRLVGWFGLPLGFGSEYLIFFVLLMMMVSKMWSFNVDVVVVDVFCCCCIFFLRLLGVTKLLICYFQISWALKYSKHVL